MRVDCLAHTVPTRLWLGFDWGEVLLHCGSACRRPQRVKGGRSSDTNQGLLYHAVVLGERPHDVTVAQSRRAK